MATDLFGYRPCELCSALVFSISRVSQTTCAVADRVHLSRTVCHYCHKRPTRYVLRSSYGVAEISPYPDKLIDILSRKPTHTTYVLKLTSIISRRISMNSPFRFLDPFPSFPNAKWPSTSPHCGVPSGPSRLDHVTAPAVWKNQLCTSSVELHRQASRIYVWIVFDPYGYSTRYPPSMLPKVWIPNTSPSYPHPRHT